MFVDIHNHDTDVREDVVKVFSHLRATGEPVPAIPFAAGVHPYHAAKTDIGLSDDDLRKDPLLVAIGEIGLDYSAKVLDKERQKEWLRRQLALAEELRLPIIVHCVKAYDDFLAEVKKYSLKAVIFHGFIGSPELATQLTRHGYYLSFGVASLRSYKTREALKVAPPDRIFFETDDVDADIKDVYAEAAAIRGVDVQELKKEVYANYKLIFG